MKKLLQMKFMLLLCALIVGSGTMWSQSDYSTDFTGNVTLSTSGGTNASTCIVNINNTDYDGIKAGTSKNAGAVKITVPSKTKYLHLHLAAWNGETVSLAVTPAGYSNNIALTSHSAVSGSGTTYTLSGTLSSSDYYKIITFSSALTEDTDLTFTASSGKRFVVWGVTAEEEGSSPSLLEDSDLALTNDPVALSFDLYNNSSAQTVSFTTSSTGAVTVSGGDGYVTTSVSGNTITVTPVAVTPNAQTITVNQAADDTYKAGSATFTVTITDSTPGFTVTLGDDNTALTEATIGAGVTLPERATTVTGYTFAGWSETNVENETTEAPTIIPAGAYSPTSNVTLYPVFTKTEGGGGQQNNSVSVNIGTYATTNNWENSIKYTSITLDENVTASVSYGGTNTGKYYSNNNSWRFYANESGRLTVSTTSGELTSVTITYTGNTLTYGGNNITSGTAVSVSGSSAEFSVSGSSGNTQITAISVDYTITGTGTTYYWSTPVAAAVEKPVITIAENPFLFSTTAEITCATSGATIMYSYDGVNWLEYSEALTITETKTIYAKAVVGTDESAVASVTATKNLAEPTVTIDATGITNTDVYVGTAAGSLSASVTYNNTSITEASITWSGDNDDVATIDAATGAVTLVAAGSVTFTAAYAGNADYSAKTATYEMTVTDSYAPGTVNNPYTVALARDAIDAGTGVTEVYARGIVSQTGTLSNGAISYYISDDGTTTDQLQAYKGKGIGGANFTSADDIQLGDIVVIKGNLKKYNSIYEFDSGNQLVSLDRPIVPTIIVAYATINVNASSQSITRGITVNNLTISDADNFHIKYYNANDEEISDPDWIEATVTVENSAYVLSCTVAANDVEARTAYLKVYAMNGDETIYSNLVTITQAQYVPDYATLPFEFDGGRADIEETNGLTQDGLDSDYGSSPYLKFNSTNDYVILKINEVPGTLTFDIKGNTFSGGTFTVQTSADGENYTDLQTYTELGSTQSEEFDIAANVRFIKWIYTEKSSGNVGLGNITLDNTSMAVTIAAACNDGKNTPTYYGTFSSSSAFVVPENLTVSEIGIDDDGKMDVRNYESGAVVPANTGVMVSATTPGNFKLIKSSAEGKSVLGAENRLRPTGDGGITAEGMVAEPVVCKYYRLTMHDGTKLGFWWGNENGTSFAVGSNKAYMAVPAGQAAREGFAFDDDSTTGISNVNVNENVNGNVFDLQGRKVNKPGKGLYIVNGKKVVIK